MNSIDDLETLRLKGLTNKLLGGDSIEELGEEFQVTIPPALTLKFICPTCNDAFPIRVVTKDMGSVNRYIKCPHCRQSSYLSTIQTVGKEQKAITDLFTWLDVIDDE